MGMRIRIEKTPPNPNGFLKKVARRAIAFGSVFAIVYGADYIADKANELSSYWRASRQSGAIGNYGPLPPMSAAFRQYAANEQVLYDEFRRSTRPENRGVPLPPGMVETDGTAVPMGFALDINNDNILEYNIEIECGGSLGCWGEMRGLVNGEFRVLLDDLAGFVSPENVGGYRNIFNIGKAYLPMGGFTEQVIKYSWDGQKYREAKKFLLPENISPVGESLATAFSEMNPEQRRNTFLELEELLGTHYTLMAFADFSSGGMIPKGMEMDYLREYSRETGKDYLNAYANNPEGFERLLLGDVSNLLILTSTDPKGYLLVGARAAAQSVARDLKQDPYSKNVERVNKIEQGSGWINAFRSRTRRDPTPFEFRNLYVQGASGAISEDQLRTYGGRVSVEERRSRSPTGETRTMEFDPLNVPGDPRYLDSQPDRPQSRQDFNQNLNRARDDASQGAERARQMTNQAEERARQMGNQIQNQLNNLFRQNNEQK